MGAGSLSTGEVFGGWRGPGRGTGAEPRWGSRGQSPRKQNKFNLLTLPKIAFPQRNSNRSHFLKRTVLLMISQLRLLIKNSSPPSPPYTTPPAEKILKSRVSQMAFPSFSRGISHQEDNHLEQKTFIKSKFAVSSSYACKGYRSPNTILSLFLEFVEYSIKDRHFNLVLWHLTTS